MTENHPRDAYLLTPGPLTTSRGVKEAMLHDWGSREQVFIDLTVAVRHRLTSIAGGAGTHTAVLLQGSGTFAIEAMIGTLMPPQGKLLALVNGAYGRRILLMTEMMKRDVCVLKGPEDQPVDPAALDRALTADRDITHVAIVHCETTAGILNPVEEIAAITARHGRRLLIDSMSAFGALPLDAAQIPFDAVAASANKCLQGAPGVGFVIVREEALQSCAQNAHSLSLDLYQQWKGFEENGQWRFTPPTHIVAALNAALDEHEAEGGAVQRLTRYRDNCRILIEGMRARGFVTLVADAHQAPIIATFLMPADPAFRFDTFYKKLCAKGFVIYPGKLTTVKSFRIGCIGALGATEIRAALAAIGEVLEEMGVASGAA